MLFFVTKLEVEKMPLLKFQAIIIKFVTEIGFIILKLIGSDEFEWIVGMKVNHRNVIVSLIRLRKGKGKASKLQQILSLISSNKMKNQDPNKELVEAHL